MKDYKRRPEVVKTYPKLMSTAPLQAMQDQWIQHESERKKPYAAPSYDEMEYPWDGWPGITPGTFDEPTAIWDFPFIFAGPVPPITDDLKLAPILYDCTADQCYICGVTTVVKINCTPKGQASCSSIRYDGTLPAGYSWSGTCEAVTITAPEGGMETLHFIVTFAARKMVDKNGKLYKNSKGEQVWLRKQEVSVAIQGCCNPRCPHGERLIIAMSSMPAGSAQILGVSPVHSGSRYTYRLDSGLGRVSGDTYYAPSLEELTGCVGPASVSLLVNDVPCDGGTIITYAPSTKDIAAYKKIGACTPWCTHGGVVPAKSGAGSCPSDRDCWGWYVDPLYYIGCDGTITNDVCRSSASYESDNCTGHFSDMAAACRSTVSLVCGTLNSTIDVRPEWVKALGCCPGAG